MSNIEQLVELAQKAASNKGVIRNRFIQKAEEIIATLPMDNASVKMEWHAYFNALAK